MTLLPTRALQGSRMENYSRRPKRSGWQVLLTMDQGIPYQQNLEGRTILVIVIRAKSNRLADLLPHVPEIQDLLQSIEPGRTIPIG